MMRFVLHEWHQHCNKEGSDNGYGVVEELIIKLV
jgi:hypothetical protein